ncbi:MAG TPA: hypothetical protein VKD26_02465 [Streptosporangiaceae bacterium]|nr:hypothetical protein [Streptosporangiaceae bacterium]
MRVDLVVIGLGHVGLPLAREAVRSGLSVIGYDRGADVTFPWAVAMALLLFPIATADLSYRYLLPVAPFAFLAAALTFAPAPAPAGQDPRGSRKRPAARHRQTW